MSDDKDQQFEQVLNRLDALMRRNHAVAEFPLQQVASAPVEAAVELAAEESEPPVFVLEEVAEIPVLTEVYDGTLPEPERRPGHELAEAFIDAVMPLMLDNLDLIIAEEAARMQQNVAERLRNEIGEELRRRLQKKD